MKRPLLPTLLAFMVLAASPALAQDRDWREASRVAADLRTSPEGHRAVSFDLPALSARLGRAETEGVPLVLPLPSGGRADVVAREASVMHPDLQARYPQIRSYTLSGGGVRGRLAVSPLGVEALLFTPSGTVLIKPSAPHAGAHAVFYTRDVSVPETLMREAQSAFHRDDDDGTPPVIGGSRRTYRLAAAATGELTREASANPSQPTVAEGLAAVNGAVTRVNAIFERDLDISFQLVANNDQIIYTDPATDPYNPANTGGGGVHFPPNRVALNSRIGESNYDVGHVLGPFDQGGGAATGAVCLDYTPTPGGGLGASKADGFSNYRLSDPNDIKTFAHELGHLSGAPHTWVQRNLTAPNDNEEGVEPRVGYSIMSYGQFAREERLPNPATGDFFHAESIRLMDHYIRSEHGNTCGTTANTGNDAPTVSVAQSTYTIPANTPFLLTGSASDASGTELAYTWEQMDQYGTQDGPSRPLFRAFDPHPRPTRLFPDPVEDYFDETLPTDAATYHFRLTARDGVGGVGAADVAVTTDPSLSMYAVTFASAGGERYVFGQPQTVTWDVNGSASHAPTVDLFYSTDGGRTFPHTLATNVANGGSHQVTFPETSGEGRVMVKASGSIYYSLSGTFEVQTYPIAGVSPGEVSATVAFGETAEAAVAISNTAAATGLDLAWSARVANAQGPSGSTPANACSADQTVAQETSGNIALPLGNGAQLHGQSVTAPCTGILTRIEVLHFRDSNAGESWSGTLRVYEGHPDHGSLFDFGTREPVWAGPVSGVNPSTTDWMALPLASPLAVDAGKPYLFFLDVTSGQTRIHEFGSNPFPDGALYAVDANGAHPQSDRDLAFRLSLGEPQGFLSLSRYDGSVAPGEAGDLGLTFDAEGYPEGTYTADLVLASNDIDQPTITVPVTMAVEAETEAPVVFSTSVYHPRGLVQLSDGRLLVVERNDDESCCAGPVSVLADDGTRTVLVPGLAEPRDLVQLADGRVLVSEISGNRVSVLSDDGSRTDFATGIPFAKDLVQLADGRVLVSAEDKVLVIEEDGTTTDFTAPEFGNYNGLLQLADGRVLVAEPTEDRVSVIGSDGSLTDFATGLGRPEDLLQLADGRVLVAEYGAGRVSVISDDGARTTFSTGLEGPEDLVQLADGRVLVSEFAADRVSIIATLGAAVVQESGDAGGLPSTAQNAVGAQTVRGTLGNTSGLTAAPSLGAGEPASADPLGNRGESETADCFTIGITDPTSFSASTLNSGTTADTDLVLFTTEGEAIAAQDDAGGTVQSLLPSEALGDRGAGYYALCVTASLNNPVNDAGEPLLPVVASEYTALRFPSAPSGDYVIASFPTINTAYAGPYVVDLTGVGVPVDAEHRPGEAMALALAVWPNPTARGARVAFTLAEAGEAEVSVFDALGRRVAVVAEGPRAAGEHEVSVAASALAAGVYVVRVRTGDAVAARTLTVVR